MALVVTVLAAVPASAEPTVPAAPGPSSYVALGDSYAAGPLIPLQTGLPAGCLRSNRNYPALVARGLGITDFRDVSCSSATTEHLGGPQNVPLGVNPPQLDALGTDTELVTLTMGGNDIGFGEIIEKCHSPLPVGTPCQDHFVKDGVDELARRIAATAPKINKVLDAVRGKAPSATVYLVGYPSVIPDSGQGCWPAVAITDSDLVYLRDILKRLNAMLATQAKANGAAYVDTYTPSIGRDVCQLPTVRWIEGLVPVNPATPFHPNARGERGFADALLATMVRTGAAAA